MVVLSHQPLTAVEKLAGRAFRDEQQAKLMESHETDPPTYVCPNFVSHFRHKCPARRGVSTAIECKEVYVLSSAYAVKGDEVIKVTQVEQGQDLEERGYVTVPAGRLAFIYREGKCRGKGCEHTARSKAGRIADAYQRPPTEGRVAR